MTLQQRKWWGAGVGAIVAMTACGPNGGSPASTTGGAGGAAGTGGVGGIGTGGTGGRDPALGGIVFYRDPDGNYKDWHSLRPASGQTQTVAAMTPYLAPIDAHRMILGNLSFSLTDQSAGTSKPLFSCATYGCDNMSVSPDGTNIAFQFHYQLTVDHIERVGIDALQGLATVPSGRDILSVASLVEFAGYSDASWAPDGALFVVDRSTLVEVKNDVPTVILRGLSGPSAPTFSPDGQRMAFIMVGGNAQIYMANRDGSGLKQLTTFAHAFESIAWSPLGDVMVAGVGTTDELGNHADEMVYVKPDGSISDPLTDSTKAQLHADRVFWLID